MKFFISIPILAALGWAQTLTATLSIPQGGTVAPGAVVTLTLMFADAFPSANVSGIEWQLALPGGVSAGRPVLGAASSAAAKTVTCSVAACIAAGLGGPLVATLSSAGTIAYTAVGTGAAANATSYSSGTVATIPLKMPSNLSPAQLPLAIQVSLASAIATSPQGTVAALSWTNLPLTLTVQ